MENENLKPPSELLAAMGYTVEEVLDKNDLSAKLVCRCGHPMIRHDEEGVCSLSRMKCHCQGENKKAVFKTQNLEVFRYADGSSGAAHPLTKGIARLAEKGQYGEWISDTHLCAFDECLATENLIPVLLDIHHISGSPQIIRNAHQRQEFYAGWKDRFACPVHYEMYLEG